MADCPKEWWTRIQEKVQEFLQSRQPWRSPGRSAARSWWLSSWKPPKGRRQIHQHPSWLFLYLRQSGISCTGMALDSLSMTWSPPNLQFLILQTVLNDPCKNTFEDGNRVFHWVFETVIPSLNQGVSKVQKSIVHSKIVSKVIFYLNCLLLVQGGAVPGRSHLVEHPTWNSFFIISTLRCSILHPPRVPSIHPSIPSTHL